MGAQDLFAQLLHQLVEVPLRPCLGEAVLGELADPAGDIRRHRIEERLAMPRVLVVAERELGSLAIHDVVQTLAQLLERPGEVELGFLLFPALLEPRPERVETPEASPHPAAEQAVDRALRACAREDVIGQLLEEVPGGDVGAEGILGPVPARVAKAHASSVREGCV